MSKFSTKKLIITGSIFVLVLIMSVFGVTFAIFNYTKTGQANTMSTSTVLFDFSDVAIDVANDFPQDGSISIEDLTVSEQTAHTGELTISGHNTLTNGVKYNIYLLHGDDITGKTRLNDENIKFQLVPNYTSGTNGFTVLSNDYANPTNLSFDNEGKALISTGLIKDTSQLTTVSYAFHMWIDGGGMNISSTTKRATLAEGNPSLADATTGNTTATRYMRNNATESSTVTLFPAKTNQVGKTIYTTYEFSNGYYNVKFLVEAVDSGELTAAEKMATIQTLETTPYGKVYTGADPDNYVWFNNEQWRIIGLYGNQIKIIKDTPSTTSQIYHDGAISTWDGSDLQSSYLYDTYYPTLSSEAKSMIDENAIWYVDRFDFVSPAESAYNQAKTTSWVGKVAVISVYEYLYAAQKSCWTTASNNYRNGCASKDWMFLVLTNNKTVESWSVNFSSYNPGSILRLTTNGYFINANRNHGDAVSPVVYLKPTVKITGGNGGIGETNSYKLGL